MRTLSINGALEFGPPSGPRIDITPSPLRLHRPLTVAEAVAATKNNLLEWRSWERAAQGVPTSTFVTPQVIRMRGVVSFVESELCIRFLYPRRQSPLDALYAIEAFEAESGGSLPPALSGAVLAATRARQFPVSSPTFIAMACDMQPPGEPTRLNHRGIEEFVDGYVHFLIGEGRIFMPSGSVDRARLWLAVGQRLWDIKERQRIAHAASSQRSGSMANFLAGARLELRAVERLEVAGVRLRLPEAAMLTAWGQVAEWERGGVPAEALRYLTGNEVPRGKLTVNLKSKPIYLTHTNDDPDLCRGLAAALLREAQEQGVYVPNGAFVLALPADYPLRAWGVSALRVWAYPTGLWVAAVDDEGQTGASFGWRPGEALSGWVVSEQAEPLLTTTLAALWRDLCVAGEDAVPERCRPERETRRRQRKQSRRAKRRSASGRTLPSGRGGRLRGRRQWGNDVEREAIQRQSHGVRGHLRRLQRGWQAGSRARGLALEFGVALPDGFTFVRPHVRGGEDGNVETTAEVVVRSRGLATVMTLLG